MTDNKKIRVVSLFSGIGGFEEGIKNANIDFEVVFASEIDDFAKNHILQILIHNICLEI